MTKVWVVMGNDYPDAVFSTEKDAEEYCKQREKKNAEEDEKMGRKSYSPRIYWRSYEFEVDDK